MFSAGEVAVLVDGSSSAVVAAAGVPSGRCCCLCFRAKAFGRRVDDEVTVKLSVRARLINGAEGSGMQCTCPPQPSSTSHTEEQVRTKTAGA